MTPLICGIEKEMIQLNLLAKQKQKTNLRFWEERIVRGFGNVMYILLCSKWINSKDLFYSTMNSIQCSVPAKMGVGFGAEWLHVYVRMESLCSSPETTTALLMGYTPIPNKKFKV